jgi:hypothetical protein
MSLDEIRVRFETEDVDVLERLTESVERLICTHPAAAEHRCPTAGTSMTIELDAAKAAEVDGVLNDLRSPPSPVHLAPARSGRT